MNVALDRLTELGEAIDRALADGHGRQVSRLLDKWSPLCRVVLNGMALDLEEKHRLIQTFSEQHARWLNAACEKREALRTEIKRVGGIRQRRRLIGRVYEPFRSSGEHVRRSM